MNLHSLNRESSPMTSRPVVDLVGNLMIKNYIIPTYDKFLVR